MNSMTRTDSSAVEESRTCAYIFNCIIARRMNGFAVYLNFLLGRFLLVAGCLMIGIMEGNGCHAS
jgi:hypothetical protein